MSLFLKGLFRLAKPGFKPALKIASRLPVTNIFNMNIVRSMANHRHKKIIRLAKGYRGRSNRCYTVAYHRVRKARQYAYRSRKLKKRDFRKLWIQRINAASRMYGVPYSRFINYMLKTDIKLNRKVLSDLAITEPLSFRSVIEVSKLAIPVEVSSDV